MNLVIGATGQLGTTIVRKLIAQGKPVRAFVRKSSDYRHLEQAGAQLAFGDLRDRASLEAACQGVEAVIATATAISPGRGGGDVKSVDSDGYANLVGACRSAGVRQIVYASVPHGRLDDRVFLARAKRETEQRIQASGISYSIFQLGMFTDIWPALLGSRIPELGAEAGTLKRPFWFLSVFRKLTGDLIDKSGRASVPGSPGTQVSFITIDDVATIMTAAVGRPDAMNKTFLLGGGEALTWADTIATFSKVLGRSITPLYTPAPIFRSMQLALSPISASASSLMGLNWIVASGALTVPDPASSRKIAEEFGVRLTTLEEFLRAKVSGRSAGAGAMHSVSAPALAGRAAE